MGGGERAPHARVKQMARSVHAQHEQAHLALLLLELLQDREQAHGETAGRSWSTDESGRESADGEIRRLDGRAGAVRNVVRGL